MASQRFLFYISYIGSKYNGMQRLVERSNNSKDCGTIQGIIEFGLQNVLRTQVARLGITSRTDEGVHAIESAAYFDYFELDKLSPEKLCRNLNAFLQQHETDIRIRRVVEVPTDFSVRRNLISRTYCYRIAVPKYNYFDSCNNFRYITSSIPITHLNRVQIVPQPFHPQAIHDVCKVFLGTWNFKTFSKPATGREHLAKKDYVKTVKRISISHINSQFEHSYYIDPRLKDIDFFDFHVEGSGFLRRQVRRMVGTLLGIGSGVIQEKDIRFMLENPSPQNWNVKCMTAEADGLFLKSVNFVEDLPIIRGSLI